MLSMKINERKTYKYVLSPGHWRDGTRLPTHELSQQSKPGRIQQHNPRNWGISRRIACKMPPGLGQSCKRAGQDAARIVIASVKLWKVSSAHCLQQRDLSQYHCRTKVQQCSLKSVPNAFSQNIM